MNATPQALEELKKVIRSEDSPTVGIRIFSSQGCCGPALQMSVVENASPGDKQISIDSVSFFIDGKAEGMLDGVTIDFGSNGFKINNMKKSTGCCG